MAALQRGLLRVWASRGLLAWLLWPLSLLFSVLAALRRLAYRWELRPVVRLPVPVIVVGNVVVGGAGKTPVVMALARHLQTRGHHPGVVARGHGRAVRGCVMVGPQSTAAEVGDEPLLVARATGLPVAVGRDRPAAAQTLLAAHPEVDVILSDDGLQHLALARDIEVCVFDDRGTGNGLRLPAGPLREAWPRPTDLVLHSGDAPAFAGHRARRRLAPEAVRGDGSRQPLSAFGAAGAAPQVALAGIAQPERFFDMLRQSGLTLTHTLALPDHYTFNSSIHKQYEGYTLICTEKDAVKLWPLCPQAWAVPLVVDVSAAFLAELDGLLGQRLAAKLSSPHGSQTA